MRYVHAQQGHFRSSKPRCILSTKIGWVAPNTGPYTLSSSLMSYQQFRAYCLLVGVLYRRVGGISEGSLGWGSGGLSYTINPCLYFRA